MTPTFVHLFWCLIGMLVFIMATSFLNILSAQYQYSITMYDRLCEARTRRRRYIEDLEAKQDLMVSTATGANAPNSLDGNVVIE